MESSLPIEGIEAERLSGSIQLSPAPFVLLDSLSPVERKPTDEGGKVAFESSGKDFAVNPRSTTPGYSRAYVTATWSGAKIVYPDERREQDVRPINGIVDIPIRRKRFVLGQKSEPSAQSESLR